MCLPRGAYSELFVKVKLYNPPNSTMCVCVCVSIANPSYKAFESLFTMGRSENVTDFLFLHHFSRQVICICK